MAENDEQDEQILHQIIDTFKGFTCATSDMEDFAQEKIPKMLDHSERAQTLPVFAFSKDYAVYGKLIEKKTLSLAYITEKRTTNSLLVCD